MNPGTREFNGVAAFDFGFHKFRRTPYRDDSWDQDFLEHNHRAELEW